MFETGPILWLQAHDGAAWLWTMRGVTMLGYTAPYAVLLLVLMFGVRLRAGLGLMFALTLVGCVTTAAKTGFELPRPADVDARVVNNGDGHRALLARGGAPGFWALPSARAIRLKRAAGEGDYGFISGHASAAAAAAVAVVVLFGVRSAPGLVVLGVWPLLMALSRMYLGRHFLADVLGGLFAGGLVAYAAARWFPRLERVGVAWWAALGAGLALAALACVTPWVKASDAGHLLGILACTALLAGTQADEPAATPGRRVLRVLVAGLAAGAVFVALHAILHWSGWGDRAPVRLLFATCGLPAAVFAALAALRVARLQAPVVAVA